MADIHAMRIVLLAFWTLDAPAATPVSSVRAVFPPSLESYDDSQMEGIMDPIMIILVFGCGYLASRAYSHGAESLSP